MKQFRKRMIATGLAVSVIVGSSVPTIKVFATSDVPENYFAKTQIEKFISEGIISGYPDGTFRPNNSITRAEFVKIVNKAFGFTEVGEKTFKDVDDNAWYSQDIKIAIKKGYINGFGDDTFRPNEEITREQMAKILGTILNVSGDGQTKFIDDSKISSWARKYVDGLADAGFISGYSNGSFNPQGNATRGESIAVISSTEEAYNQNIENNNTSTDGSNNNSTGSGGGNNSTGSGSSTGSVGGSTSEGTGTGSGNQTGSGEEDNSSGNGEQTGSGGEDNSTGNGNQTDSETGTKADATTSKSDDLSKLLNNNNTVEFTGNTISTSVVIPEGKTLIISNDAQITENIDATKGNVIVDGEVKLSSNGKITTFDASTYSLSRQTNTAKITGNGKIIVNEGKIHLRNIQDLEVDFVVGSKSIVQINDLLFFDGLKNLYGEALVTIHTDDTKLEFDFNSTGDNIDYVTVDGQITLNDSFNNFVFKAKDNNSMINLPDRNRTLPDGQVIADPTTATLYGLGHVKGGAYKGSGNNNSWTKLDRAVTVKTSMESTTNSSIISSEKRLKGGIGVSRDTSKDRYNENTTITLLDYYSDPMGANVFDIDEVDEFRILINLGKDKLLTGIKFNGESYSIENDENDKINVNISDEIQPGDLITLNIRRDDYEKLGLKTQGDVLEFVGVECTKAHKEEDIKVSTSIINSQIDQIQSTTIGSITTSETITSNSSVDTKIEFLVDGKSVSSFDMNKIKENDSIEVKISLGKEKTIQQVVLNSHVLSELPSQIEKGSVVSIKLTRQELHELIWAQTNYEDFKIVVVEK